MTITAARATTADRYFEVSGAWTPTARMLEEAGLPSERLARVLVNLVRLSQTGKWHVAPVTDRAWARCSHLSRAVYDGRALPVQRVSLLGGYDLCGVCAARLEVPGPAGAYLAVSRLIVAAGAWVDALEKAAPAADWLAYARWTALTPFSRSAVMPALIAALKGARGWTDCRAAAQTAWQRLRQRADAGWETARQAAGPPGLRVHAARARDRAGADRVTREESQLIAAIATRPDPWQYSICPDPWDAASSAWLAAVSADGDVNAARTAMLVAVEKHYGHAQVRDVALLPSPAIAPGAAYCSPAMWAQAEYRLLRHAIVAGWCNRLEAGLAPTQHESSDQWRLLLVTGWPLTHEPDREIAYLAQYPELARATDLTRDRSYGQAHPPWAVVLHVPGFAAEHALTHRSDYHSAVAGPVVPAGSQPGLADVRALLRRACYYVAEDAADDPGQPLPWVAAQRDEFRRRSYRTDFASWIDSGAKAWDLPSGWSWIPGPDDGTDGASSCAEILPHLHAAFSHHPLRLYLAAGPHDSLQRAEMRARLQDVNSGTRSFSYVADQDMAADLPTTVPFRRLIAVAADR
jgi:hypothetical protein